MGEFYNNQWRLLNNENKDKSSNYSMRFDGANSGDTVVSETISNLGISTAFSVSFWFKADSLPTYSSLVIAPANAGNWNSGFGFITPSNNKLRFWVGGWLYANSYIDSDTLTLETWYHVVGTFNNTDGLKLYINSGTPSTATNTTLTGLSNVVNIGSSFGSYNYDGLLDHVAIFDYALSSSQVTSLYGNSTNGVGNPMSLSTK